MRLLLLLTLNTMSLACFNLHGWACVTKSEVDDSINWTHFIKCVRLIKTRFNINLLFTAKVFQSINCNNVVKMALQRYTLTN